MGSHIELTAEQLLQYLNEICGEERIWATVNKIRSYLRDEKSRMLWWVTIERRLLELEQQGKVEKTKIFGGGVQSGKTFVWRPLNISYKI